jgi:hypothetical protein
VPGRADALERVGRGLYALPGREVGASEALVQVAKRVPGGVICLLTALRFYDLTDQNPSTSVRSPQISRGLATPSARDELGGAADHDFAAFVARAGPEVDDVVALGDDL